MVVWDTYAPGSPACSQSDAAAALAAAGAAAALFIAKAPGAPVSVEPEPDAPGQLPYAVLTRVLTTRWSWRRTAVRAAPGVG